MTLPIKLQLAVIHSRVVSRLLKWFVEFGLPCRWKFHQTSSVAMVSLYRASCAAAPDRLQCENRNSNVTTISLTLTPPQLVMFAGKTFFVHRVNNEADVIQSIVNQGGTITPDLSVDVRAVIGWNFEYHRKL